MRPTTSGAAYLRDLASSRPLPARGLEVFAASANQSSMLLLECVVAVVAVCTVALWFRTHLRPRALGLRGFLVCAISLAAGLAWTAHSAYSMTGSTVPVAGFLSKMLISLSAETDGRVTLGWTKLIGETAGMLLAVAAASLAAFGSRPSRAELALRYVWFRRLLYTSSGLFVVGTMVSRSNFVWVVSHWTLSTEPLEKAAATVVTAGTTQVSIAYSALLAAAFLPLRLLLDSHLDAHVQKADQPAWLSQVGVSPSWGTDVRQLAGLLAPMLAAPLFDAFAKL